MRMVERRRVKWGGKNLGRHKYEFSMKVMKSEWQLHLGHHIMMLKHLLLQTRHIMRYAQPHNIIFQSILFSPITLHLDIQQVNASWNRIANTPPLTSTGTTSCKRYNFWIPETNLHLHSQHWCCQPGSINDSLLHGYAMSPKIQMMQCKIWTMHNAIPRQLQWLAMHIYE